MFNAADHAFMARALRQGERARCWARPNPHVGCVIVSGDEVVGEGHSQPAGGHHAEVMALAQAGERAAGATAYVTLEPCCHHGRTPPCTDALIGAGIRRVVIGHEDPDPRVDGGGMAQLRAAGVAVEQGLCRDLVAEQLRGFLLRQRRGRGRLRIKIAASLDGRTAMASGESQWITGPQARRDVQRLRAGSCAIVTGVGTVLADDCALTVREAELPATLQLPPAERRALRVVLDSRLRTPRDARVLQGGQPSLLVHAGDTGEKPALADVDRCVVGDAGGGLDLAAVLTVLTDRECNEILLESGPTLAGAVLQAGLADELVVYLAPKLLGSSARPMLALPLVEMAEAYDLALTDRRQLGDDLRMTFSLQASRA